MLASPLLVASAHALNAVEDALDALNAAPDARDRLLDDGIVLDMIRAQGTFRTIVDRLNVHA